MAADPGSVYVSLNGTAVSNQCTYYTYAREVIPYHDSTTQEGAIILEGFDAGMLKYIRYNGNCYVNNVRSALTAEIYLETCAVEHETGGGLYLGSTRIVDMVDVNNNYVVITGSYSQSGGSPKAKPTGSGGLLISEVGSDWNITDIVNNPPIVYYGTTASACEGHWDCVTTSSGYFFDASGSIGSLINLQAGGTIGWLRFYLTNEPTPTGSRLTPYSCSWNGAGSPC